MKKKYEICHVCKKEKKPYTVFITNSILSMMTYREAREKGPICQRCDRYFAMTGKFKDATKEEYEIAKKSSWFARMMSKWWEKDGKLNIDRPNKRGWAGTVEIAKWCRKELGK